MQNHKSKSTQSNNGCRNGYRILVCGSRAFASTEKGQFEVDSALSHSPDSMILAATLDGLFASAERLQIGFVIVHGGCPTGGDAVAESWCSTRGVEAEVFPADWSLGRKAGPIRNQKMIDTLTPKNPRHLVIAAWDLQSSGTKSTVRFAKKKKLPVISITSETEFKS